MVPKARRKDDQGGFLGKKFQGGKPMFQEIRGGGGIGRN